MKPEVGSKVICATFPDRIYTVVDFNTFVKKSTRTHMAPESHYDDCWFLENEEEGVSAYSESTRDAWGMKRLTKLAKALK